jgi:hypothetical protein
MASKRRLRRVCDRKRQYATQAEAWGHVQRLRRLNGNDDYRAYRCAFGHWHVGRPRLSTIAGREAALG